MLPVALVPKLKSPSKYTGSVLTVPSQQPLTAMVGLFVPEPMCNAPKLLTELPPNTNDPPFKYITTVLTNSVVDPVKLMTLLVGVLKIRFRLPLNENLFAVTRLEVIVRFFWVAPVLVTVGFPLPQQPGSESVATV